MRAPPLCIVCVSMAEYKKVKSKGPPRSRVQSGPLRQTALKLEKSPGAGGSASKGRTGPSASKGEPSSQPGKLEYSEMRGDLFSSPPTASLAHCVSEDLAMGKGIAVLFKDKFKRVGELKSQGVRTGGVAVLKDKERYIYYLVTKKRHFHKPTYPSLQSSLSAMLSHCQVHEVKELAMPKIGCGLDQLSWDKVKEMIRKTFWDLEISITVYYL